ncbi:hypothetical protein [Telmatospirillum sp.]|uniref:TSCPD domain-containing protein n=1 Tax=Telmatospirillum sp. TaxID=2079197 RepID=UPI0028526411|nr:hypothetical protein [Telmatospirillum sp.]
MDEQTFRTGRYPDGSLIKPEVHTGRVRIPNRRDCDTLDFDWRGQRWTVSVYRDDDGEPREIFLTPALKGAKPESDIHAAANLAAILVSTLLQYGERLADLTQRLTAGGWGTGADDQPLILAAMNKALEKDGEND